MKKLFTLVIYDSSDMFEIIVNDEVIVWSVNESIQIEEDKLKELGIEILNRSTYNEH